MLMLPMFFDIFVKRTNFSRGKAPWGKISPFPYIFNPFFACLPPINKCNGGKCMICLPWAPRGKWVYLSENFFENFTHIFCKIMNPPYFDVTHAFWHFCKNAQFLSGGGPLGKNKQFFTNFQLFFCCKTTSNKHTARKYVVAYARFPKDENRTNMVDPISGNQVHFFAKGRLGAYFDVERYFWTF